VAQFDVNGGKPMSRERFDKIIAIAVNPGAFEDEAIAALLKARQLAKDNPSLAHPPSSPPVKPSSSEASKQFTITKIKRFWLNIIADNISSMAYGLDLKSKISFKQRPVALSIRCDGTLAACNALEAHLHWLIDYVNSQPAQPAGRGG
jgi:hypothetical protein